MGFTFVPEYFFKTFDEADADFLINVGVRGVVLDVDNTLEPYENPLPGKKVRDWLNALHSKGIKTAIVSNNDAERINLFNKDLNMPAYFKAKKPFKKNILNAIGDMGTTLENTILIGDQVFTDVWAAHNAGIRAILVLPIKDKTDALTKFKRILEKPILRKYNKNKL